MNEPKSVCALALGMWLTALLGAPALAQQSSGQARPEILTRLLDCRAETNAARRLACYDAAASILNAAEQEGEVVIVDRQQVVEARRQLFGFQLPSMPDIFQRGSQPDTIESIETTLTRAGQYGEGKWTFNLADGSQWRQLDSEPVRFRNQPDQPVRVRRAALGSYLLTVGGSRAVRVRRQ